MPIGNWSVYPKIIQGTLSTQPTSVLDIGIGFGMNGCMVRNWMDLGVQPFKTKLIGVEVFEDYRNPAWDLYDEVLLGDVMTMCLPEVDFILMTDVLEHFTLEDGHILLQRLKDKAKKAVIVSTPNVWMEQGAMYGNDYETHRSLWNQFEFIKAGYNTVHYGVDEFGHNVLIADYIR